MFVNWANCPGARECVFIETTIVGMHNIRITYRYNNERNRNPGGKITYKTHAKTHNTRNTNAKREHTKHLLL